MLALWVVSTRRYLGAAPLASRRSPGPSRPIVLPPPGATGMVAACGWSPSWLWSERLSWRGVAAAVATVRLLHRRLRLCCKEKRLTSTWSTRHITRLLGYSESGRWLGRDAPNSEWRRCVIGRSTRFSSSGVLEPYDAEGL